jgi:hypothetical protein
VSEWVKADRGVVFSGRVTRVRRAGHDLEITFTAIRIWKGEIGRAVVVRTGQAGGGDCGFSFRRGQRYLVYAKAAEDRLYTSVCTPTAKLRDAADDPRVLGKGKTPAP